MSRTSVVYWTLALVVADVVAVCIGTVGSYVLRFQRGIGTQRLLIVGTGEPAHLVLERVLHTPGTGYRPVGFVAETSELSVVHGLPVLGTLDCIGATVAQHQIDDVVVAMPTLSQQR